MRRDGKRPSVPPVSERKLISAAQIVKSYNTNGEILVRMTSGLLEDFNLQEPVFVLFDGLPVPFFIESFRPRGNGGALIKLESVDDETHSKELIRKQLLIDPASAAGEPESYEEDDPEILIGCILQDQDGREAGTVSDFLDYPGNPCLEIRRPAPENTVFLIPFHEELILGFDPQRRILRMTVPEGLTAL